MIKTRVAFCRFGVSDCSDRAKKSKCQGLRPLYKGVKSDNRQSGRRTQVNKTLQKSRKSKQPRTTPTRSKHSIHFGQKDELVQQEVQISFLFSEGEDHEASLLHREQALRTDEKKVAIVELAQIHLLMPITFLTVKVGIAWRRKTASITAAGWL